MLGYKLLDTVKTLIDAHPVQKRLLDPGAQHAGTHGCAGPVQQLQKRSFPVPPAD